MITALVGVAAVLSKAVIQLWLFYCLMLLPLCMDVLVLVTGSDKILFLSFQI